ncbi:MAG: hypothetical protein M1830_008872 [Pleopsidium flavum]|nr:MAG: hypothetical protein M1830_008872 [Pleopsidium flavum]
MAVKPVQPETTTTPTPAQTTLSFPAQTFAKLSPAPFLLAHLELDSASKPSIRPNGRAPSEFRPPTGHTGSLTHASGSAVVRVGDTAVVCGVRGEILLASDVPGYRVGGNVSGTGSTGQTGDAGISEIGLLVPNLELATGCSPAHLPGNPPSTLAQSLSERILSLLHASKLVKAEDLRIWHQPPSANAAEDGVEGDEPAEPEVKAFWCLYIDLLFISLDGNPFDAAWAAVVAALRDTRLPHAWWDIDREMILCDDAIQHSRKLGLMGMPFVSTFAVFEPRQQGGGNRKGRRAWILADPDTFEEGLCRESVSVVVDCTSSHTVKIVKIEKDGGGIVGLKEMREVVEMAGERWRQWQKVVAS